MVPSVPPMDPALQRQRLGRLAWIRVGLGAVAGIVAGLLNFVTLQPNVLNPTAYYGIYVGVIFYIGSFYLARYSLLKGINPKDKNKLFTQGIGSFIIMFIFAWILYTTYYACLFYASCHI
jgi:hypothetical protein